MKPLNIHVVVIEYDIGRNPTRIAGTSDDIVRAHAAKNLLDNPGWWGGKDFLATNPAPKLDHAGEVGHWLGQLRETRDSPWVSIEEIPLHDSLPEG